MALDADEEILQDFLVEAGEILEKLSEQLVDLEQNPDDSDLLNAIFRGFHTVKGGAGFLQLDALVNCCHSAENVFDILRNHKRKVDSELMDVVLEALDHVNAMFEQVRHHEEPTPAPEELIAALDALAQPAGESSPANAAVAREEQNESNEASSGDDGGDITDDEFERLLDALEEEKTSAPVSSDDGNEFSGGDGGSGDDISDDEFEALLDQLHGKGQFSGPPETGKTAPDSQDASGDKVTSDEASDSKGGDDLISDDEFEKLLDDLHGKGGSPTAETAKPAPGPAAKQPSATSPSAKADKPAQPTGKPEKAPADNGKAGVTPAMPARDANAPVAETSVRVDTKRLDDIMNMVGELVLVRNRLQRLGAQSEDEHMHKAVSNLDVVTTDLQSAVMATRMQPIKKVFGRFPRVVRDLARSLKKEINLEMHGEETDLDKNLVEALSDPLVHLVRNSVDHGIEAPDIREKAGKPRQGRVTLSAEQEGDHILLSIEDDGAGMDPDVLRRKAVEKGIY